MTRTIQTALTAFGPILQGPGAVPLIVWPDLREAHDAICNKGVSRSMLMESFPHLDFSLCMVEWEYEAHSDEAAIRRAEKVKADLWECNAMDILIISHRGFISYLVAGSEFSHCGA
jgi:broad specificity phosphatase PhoE